MMSQAMGRSLPNILFSAFGSVVTASGRGPDAEGRSVRAGTAEDIGVLLAYARKVVIIPGLRPGRGPGPARRRASSPTPWRRGASRSSTRSTRWPAACPGT